MNEGDESEAGRHLIFTDGSCSRNRKPEAFAGYGVFFGYGNRRNVAAWLDGDIQTNQRAELKAMEVALQFVNRCQQAMGNDGSGAEEAGQGGAGETGEQGAKGQEQASKGQGSSISSGRVFKAMPGDIDSLHRQLEECETKEFTDHVLGKGGFAVTIVSDSAYCVNGYNSWLAGWVKRDWKSSKGKDVCNQDLWVGVKDLKQAIEGSGLVDLRVRWVKGHAACPGNEEADTLAVRGRNMHPLRYGSEHEAGEGQGGKRKKARVEEDDDSMHTAKIVVVKKAGV